MTYEEQCNKYFSPLEEISEAIVNGEGICGITHDELIMVVRVNRELKSDLELFGSHAV